MVAATGTIVKFMNVTVSYANFVALRNVTFSLERGRILGFLGPNGAGKTTTSYTILRLLEPCQGRCEVGTREIGFMLDKPGLLDDLTLVENFEFLIRLRKSDPPRVEERQIEWITHLVGLDGCGEKPVKTFSTGMKKRGELGRALLFTPELLVLDEPFSGLDPIGQVEFRDLVRNLANKQHSAVFITSHNLAEVEAICDEFVIINKGEIQTHSTIEKLHESGKTLEQLYIEMVKK